MTEQQASTPPAASLSFRKKLLFFCFFNLFLVVALFGGLEYLARSIQARRLGPRSTEPQALRDRFTAWRNNPKFGRVDIQHNAQGFRREGDVAEEKPPGTVRIFLLGGSAAYGCEGLYPEIEDRFKRIYNNQLIDHFLELKLNAAYPARRWEVINAATNEFRMHQHQTLIQAVLLRYRPDYIVFMDGHNDISGLLLMGPEPYDPYAETPHLDEFEYLANPQTPGSFRVFFFTWLRARSVFFRTAQDWLEARANRTRRSDAVTAPRQASVPVKASELTAEEQAQAGKALRQAGYYAMAARRIHRILQLASVRPVFLLQPQLILSRKPPTETEKKLAAFHRVTKGPLFIYAYEQLYPEIARQMNEAAQQDGFHFLSLVDVFDRAPEQAFSDYCHLTPDGNGIIADRIIEFMKDEFAALAAGKK